MGADAQRRRLLIYSHDTFGLGHLRRCRTIAHALVEARRDLSVLILSGSPIVGSFSFRSRVDFVRIPGVIKLRRGDYTPLNLHIGIEQTLRLRESIIRHTAETFDPDLMLVDKEPLGLRGEVRNTLAMLKARGVPLLLGLRDVIDDPRTLALEWTRKKAVPALRELYDGIWIYGLPSICDPLDGIPLPASVRAKVLYTGYLRRTVPSTSGLPSPLSVAAGEAYVLVTAGGGGDGATVMDWVLRAYEHDPDIPHPAVLVLGPFMRSAAQAGFMERARRLKRVHAITFDADIERLMASAAGIVAMGGYNTFCEILSFDRPSVIVPRTTPRLEQHIRATRAKALGLADLLPADGDRAAHRMARIIRELPSRPPPSTVRIPGLLDGLPVICAAVDELLNSHREQASRPLGNVATAP